MGPSAPCLSDLSSMRLPSVLLIMVASTRGAAQASPKQVGVTVSLEYDPKVGPHYWGKTDILEPLI